MDDDEGFREFVTARSPALLRTGYGRPDPTQMLIEKAIAATPARVRQLVALTVPGVESALQRDTREKLTGLRVHWAGSTPAGRPYWSL